MPGGRHPPRRPRVRAHRRRPRHPAAGLAAGRAAAASGDLRARGVRRGRRPARVREAHRVRRGGGRDGRALRPRAAGRSVTAAPGLDLVAALRGSRLFAELPDDGVGSLAASSRSVDLAPGEVLMSEGSPPDAMYVVTDGELEITRHSTGAELLLNVCGPGHLIGELGVAHGRPRSATVRGRGPARVQRIGAEALDTLLAHPTAARALLTATTRRLDREEGLLRQQERMAALGGLAAGLLHEVNNPAAAVQRGASRLRVLLGTDDAAANPLRRLVGAQPPPEDPLAQADAEAAVAGALTAAGVAGG